MATADITSLLMKPGLQPRSKLWKWLGQNPEKNPEKNPKPPPRACRKRPGQQGVKIVIGKAAAAYFMSLPSLRKIPSMAVSIPSGV